MSRRWALAVSKGDASASGGAMRALWSLIMVASVIVAVTLATQTPARAATSGPRVVAATVHSNWTQLHPTSSPSPRDAVMAYDPKTDQTVLFGGYNGIALVTRGSGTAPTGPSATQPRSPRRVPFRRWPTTGRPAS